MLVKELFRARSRVAKTVWMALAERDNLVHAAGIHVTSAMEAAQLGDFRLPLEGRVFEVANGVSIDIRSPSAASQAQPFILMLGRVSWKKRIELALEALARLEGVRLVVAGGDDEGLTESLRVRAASLGVTSRVEFVGAVAGERKVQLLRDALVLLMPSMSENFGNSVLEALAVGTPAVVTPEVGVADLLTASGGGVVVDATAGAIAAAIRSLVLEPQLRARMSARGAEAVAANYSWPRIAARMEAEYRTMLVTPPVAA
jgi:glycosyltransferase involved in cell wall biosynthesis